MSIDQSSIQTKLNEGHAALWEHDWDGAVQAYNKALAAAPDNDSALAGKGLALFHQKRYTDSLRIFQELTRKNPNDPMPMERIARIYEREGLLTEAAHSFYQAGELQLKNRDVDRALSDYRTVLRFDPENQNVRARLGMVFSKLGKSRKPWLNSSIWLLLSNNLVTRRKQCKFSNMRCKSNLIQPKFKMQSRH